MTTRISDETRARIAAAWPDILSAIAGGGLVRDALKAANVDRQALAAWKLEAPERRMQWEEAQEASAAAFMDEAVDVARGAGYIAKDKDGNVCYDKAGEPLIIRPDSAHARTLVDTLKWAARIRNPRAYSDKATLDVNVKTIDLTRIITEANARLANARAPRVLEHDGAGLERLSAHAAGAAISERAAKLLELL